MAAAQQGGQSDNSAALIWGVSALFATLIFIWWAFKKYIILIYLSIKSIETQLLNLVSNNHFAQLEQTIQAALANPSTLVFSDLIKMGDGVGDWLRFPIVIMIFVLAVVVYLGNTTRFFTQIYSMRDFVKLEKQIWPQITPVVNLDLLKTDLDTGPWAMAMTPMQFCKKNKLLQEVRAERKEGMSRKDWDRVEVILKRGEANRIFALQIGALWKGVDQLPPYARALFAIFAARINADSKTVPDLLGAISASSATKLDFSGTEELLKKHLNSKRIQSIIQSHAYVMTVMASMLEGAREDGVQASADFLWLKPVDRRLWYTLNTVGRQTPFTEIAGIYAHWIAEKEAGRRLVVPMVEEATKALEIALKEVVYRPDEER
jgi:intracellular multiplication protein IcmP